MTNAEKPVTDLQALRGRARLVDSSLSSTLILIGGLILALSVFAFYIGFEDSSGAHIVAGLSMFLSALLLIVVGQIYGAILDIRLMLLREFVRRNEEDHSDA